MNYAPYHEVPRAIYHLLQTRLEKWLPGDVNSNIAARGMRLHILMNKANDLHFLRLAAEVHDN
jgi:hypothetical protein